VRVDWNFLEWFAITPAIPISTEFLERLRRRDPEPLAEAVHEHARPLLRAARSLGFAKPEAEDMVQDVFRTFPERVDNFEGRSQLRTWLFGILHRKALELRRAAAMDDCMDPIDIRGCMDGVPVNQREAFVLREVGGLGTSGICKILIVRVTNFGVLMHRGRARLREWLEAKGLSKPEVERRSKT
jgi:RNA polymerase sigma-70 factor (ECF subfamily)